MRIALVAITKAGAAHALKLSQALPGAELWVSEKQRAEGQAGASYFPALKDAARELWGRVDGIVFFVSLGAVIRTVAPLLKGKDEDPAVVVVDEACRFSISALSGHVGGANELAEQVAGLLGAQAVLTTASDSLATIPVDILGRHLGWVLEGKDKVTPVSAAVVNGLPVAFVQEAGEPDWWTRPTPLPASIQRFTGLGQALAARSDWGAILLVSERSISSLAKQLGEAWPRTVVYRPKTLMLGMGCDRGASAQELEALVDRVFEAAELSPLCVGGLATIDLKEKEPALNALAASLGVKLSTFTNDQLNVAGVQSQPNPLVEIYTGAVGVCEPAAMLLAGAQDLVVKKEKGSRCTLAIARKPQR
jgi:cobalt-precorrin 5A hydrolase